VEIERIVQEPGFVAGGWYLFLNTKGHIRVLLTDPESLRVGSLCGNYSFLNCPQSVHIQEDGTRIELPFL
jgi:hypothetical protein